ncbi:MAG: hypothetical protein CYPHOPRED_000605 [Cyphobasidiales sp. Tagirdzhanova-0007]|nr:MAG: hypothetical protein CYPHOPRED_000605 [Cyphobasidiales sp. Tagirdzhanova-0007]
MPSQPHLPRMPRIYLIRHGETEWSLSGAHTGRSDIPLTKNGEEVLSHLGQQIVGDGNVLDRQNHIFRNGFRLSSAFIAHSLSKIYKSPRTRAQKTYELLFRSYKGGARLDRIPNETTEEVAEWDYGLYDGITSQDIHSQRPDWDIFKDGCPEGESVDQVTLRVDGMIEKVKEIHREYWQKVQDGKYEAGTQGGDVLIVTHGHFSKCFLARWCELPLITGKHFIVDAGGLSVGSYDHRDLREPALQALNLYAL